MSDAEKMREAAARVCDDEDQELAYGGQHDLWRAAQRALKEAAVLIRALPVAALSDPAAEALRAAAPDLYEALAAVVDLHDNETADVSRMSVARQRHYFDCWNRARAALGKAREGAPDRQPPVELVRPD